jgi:hypothetical protein
MSIVSSPWCLDRLVHLAEQSGSTGLKRFLQKAHLQIQQLVPDQTYDQAKAAYYKLAAVENVSKTTEQNIKDAYNAELAKLPEFFQTAVASGAASTSAPILTIEDADIPTTSTSSQIPAIDQPPDASSSQPPDEQTPPKHRVSEETSPGQRTPTSPWRRSLNSVRRSYSAMFSDFRRDKGKGKAVSVV